MNNNKKSEHIIGMFIVQNGKEGDDCLHRPGFDVNQKLFLENYEYNKIIQKIIEYMKTVLCTTFKDYNKLKGISGANIGIPFNIVAVLHDSGIEVFINPVVTKVSKSKITVSSNCGSINLPKPISISRHAWIRVKWMDIKGEQYERYFTDKHNPSQVGNSSLTLQHEIDHNQGILITDLKNKKKGG